MRSYKLINSMTKPYSLPLLVLLLETFPYPLLGRMCQLPLQQEIEATAYNRENLTTQLVPPTELQIGFVLEST